MYLVYLSNQVLSVQFYQQPNKHFRKRRTSELWIQSIVSVAFLTDKPLLIGDVVSRLTTISWLRAEKCDELVTLWFLGGSVPPPKNINELLSFVDTLTSTLALTEITSHKQCGTKLKLSIMSSFT